MILKFNLLKRHCIFSLKQFHNYGKADTLIDMIYNGRFSVDEHLAVLRCIFQIFLITNDCEKIRRFYTRKMLYNFRYIKKLDIKAVNGENNITVYAIFLLLSLRFLINLTINEIVIKIIVLEKCFYLGYKTYCIKKTNAIYYY